MRGPADLAAIEPGTAIVEVDDRGRTVDLWIVTRVVEPGNSFSSIRLRRAGTGKIADPSSVLQWRPAAIGTRYRSSE